MAKQEGETQEQKSEEEILLEKYAAMDESQLEGEKKYYQSIVREDTQRLETAQMLLDSSKKHLESIKDELRRKKKEK